MEKTLAEIDWMDPTVGVAIANASRSLSDYYFRQSYGDQPNMATARLVLPLLDFLDEMTSQLDDQWQGGGGQTGADLDAWKVRLSLYQEATRAAPLDDYKAIQETVTGPLLQGWYPGENQQRVKDAVTPIQILHTIQADRKAHAEAWRRLGDDLTRAYGNAAEAAGKAAEGAAEAAEKGAGWLFDPTAQHRLLLIPAALGVVGGVVLAIRRGLR